jgi:6-phosphogluconolactonase
MRDKLKFYVLSQAQNQSFLETFESKGSEDLSDIESTDCVLLPPQISWAVSHADPEKWIFVQEQGQGNLILGMNSQIPIPSGGADPCHLLTFTKDGDEFWAVSHYGCGTLSFFKNHKLFQQICFERSGVDAERQKSSHRHFSLLSPCGEYLLSTDLGADRIDIFKIQKNALELKQSFALPTGMGPRHLCFDKNGFLWGTSELSNQIFVCLWSAGRLQFIEAIQATHKETYTRNYPSHCMAFGDGVVVSNRGAESMVCCTLQNMQIHMQSEWDVNATFPRHFSVDLLQENILVGSQHHSNICLVKSDSDSNIVNTKACVYWCEFKER